MGTSNVRVSIGAELMDGWRHFTLRNYISTENRSPIFHIPTSFNWVYISLCYFLFCYIIIIAFARHVSACRTHTPNGVLSLLIFFSISFNNSSVEFCLYTAFTLLTCLFGATILWARQTQSLLIFQLTRGRCIDFPAAIARRSLAPNICLNAKSNAFNALSEIQLKHNTPEWILMRKIRGRRWMRRMAFVERMHL